jgi:hypothetical protein
MPNGGSLPTVDILLTRPTVYNVNSFRAEIAAADGPYPLLTRMR